MNLLFVLIITLTPKEVKPSVYQAGKARYNIINPLYSEVVVTLNCGLDYNLVEVDVKAKGSTMIDVSEPNGDPGVCWMESYKRAK